MRETAQAATPGPWALWDGWGPTSDALMGFSRLGPASGERVIHHEGMSDIYATRADAEHIAHAAPPFILAVADWLDDEADWIDAGSTPNGPALAVARAWRADQ